MLPEHLSEMREAALKSVLFVDVVNTDWEPAAVRAWRVIVQIHFLFLDLAPRPDMRAQLHRHALEGVSRDRADTALKPAGYPARQISQ
jgi:hypothetical protein